MTQARVFQVLGALIGPLFATSVCFAQSVALTGVLGSKALLVINGGAPKALAPNEQFQGVRVLKVQGQSAEIEVQGQRQTVRMGESPVSIGEGLPQGTRRVVLRGDGAGHFKENGHINNKSVQYMVDTGASVVGISRPDAERLGLDFEAAGQPVTMNTANGRVQGWKIRLETVRLGDILVHGVDAVVTPQPMPYVLLGNSFLSQVHMTRQGNQMVLEQR